MHELY